MCSFVFRNSDLYALLWLIAPQTTWLSKRRRTKCSKKKWKRPCTIYRTCNDLLLLHTYLLSSLHLLPAHTSSYRTVYLFIFHLFFSLNVNFNGGSLSFWYRWLFPEWRNIFCPWFGMYLFCTSCRVRFDVYLLWFIFFLIGPS